VTNNRAGRVPGPAFFTPPKLYELCCKAVKGTDVRPSPTDHALETLSDYLNILRWRAQNWTGPWEKHHEECKKIAEAIRVLAEVLPSHRESFAAEVHGAERWENDPTMSADFKAGLADARANVAAMDALIAAVTEARERGLPLAHIMNAVSSAAERWQDIAPDLKRIFQSALPKRSDAAAYRFIEAVVPDITNEKPTFDIIKDTFKRSKSSRLVNRGNRFS
jgi:hypothetical protein